MKITLTMSDELYEHYKEQTTNGNVASTLLNRLKHYKDANPDERPVILSTPLRRRIEDILDTTLEGPEEIATLCERLAKISMDGVEYQLTVDELERLEAQAGFMGEEFPAYTERVLGEAVRYILNLG